MARGPKPDPAAVRKAKGNPGKRPIGEDPSAKSAGGSDAVPAGNGIAAPSWLEGGARDIWNAHAPIQHRLKLLSDADVNAFGRYCEMFQQWIDCVLDIRANGMTYEVESNHGSYRRPNPAFVMMKSLNLDLLRIEDRYGMNPAERQRIFASRAGGGRQPGELDLPGGSNARPDHAHRDTDLDAADKMTNRPGPVGLLN